MNNDVSIFMCANEGIADGLILTALSVAKHSKRVIRLYIGTMDLTNINEGYIPVSDKTISILSEILKEKNSESFAQRVDLGKEFLEHMQNSKNIGTHYTPYAMLRLLADKTDVFPDKLIYLDCDVMLHGDIGELYDIDVSDYDFAAAKDYYGRWLINPRYLNSGVMLWNMPVMKKNGVFEKARKMCKEKKMLLCDQTALNRAAKKKLILKDRFNEQHKADENTLVRHFSMRIRWLPYFKTEKIKPWQPELIRDRLGIYYYDDLIERWQKIKNTYYTPSLDKRE